MCFGVDSHAISDPFEEARAVELDERSHREGRTLVASATTLLHASTESGYRAVGFDQVHAQDRVLLRADDPALCGLSREHLDDAVIYGANPRCVSQVRVGGRELLEAGIHKNYPEIRQSYLATLARLSRDAGLT